MCTTIRMNIVFAFVGVVPSLHPVSISVSLSITHASLDWGKFQAIRRLDKVKRQLRSIRLEWEFSSHHFVGQNTKMSIFQHNSRRNRKRTVGNSISCLTHCFPFVDHLHPPSHGWVAIEVWLTQQEKWKLSGQLGAKENAPEVSD